MTPALALTMISMGMTLTPSDFKEILKQPQFPLVGFVCQYSIMPTLALLSARLFSLGPELTSGLILVGCAPGGTASNLVTLISKADVALSVLMTAFSTIGAIFMTPYLTSKLAGSIVTINPSDLVVSTLQVVLAPVLIGVFLNTTFPEESARASEYTPFMSVLLIALICGTISASNASVAAAIPAGRLLGAVTTLHSGGFLLGYILARFVAGAGEQQARTISIETGMQNSALASVLAQHFPNPILTALPGCWSATVHSMLGSLLAAWWRRRSAGAEKKGKKWNK